MINRIPSGLPSSGQFSASARNETDVELTGSPRETISNLDAHDVRPGVDFPAPPSTNTATGPYRDVTTLHELCDTYEAATSPENISRDGTRPGRDARSERTRLTAAYWVRRDELDPKREFAYCIVCDTVVPGNGTIGLPNPHGGTGPNRCY